MPGNASVWLSFLMCIRGLGAAVSRVFNSVRKNGSSSHSYSTISNDTNQLVQSDPATAKPSQSTRSGKHKPAGPSQPSGRKKLSLINRQRDSEANPGKTGKGFKPQRPDPPKIGNDRGPADDPPKQFGDISRPPRPDPPSGIGGRASPKRPDARPKQLDDGPKQLGEIVRPPRPERPANVGARRLSDTRRKQLGDIFCPKGSDPPVFGGNRRVNEGSPKQTGSVFGNEPKVTKKTDNSPTKPDNSPKVQSGSSAKNTATIKLPKRRSSLQKTQQSPNSEVKPARTPVDTEGNRVAALKQRLYEMQRTNKRESRRISIPISRSEGNVAKKTRSLEDKLFGGADLAPTLFPLFTKPKKNVTGQGQTKPTLERSFSTGSCAFSSIKFEEFFKPY